MNSERRVRALNNTLGVELGRVITGDPQYKWIWSEDPALMHPMRVPDKFDFKADESGLLVAHPVYAPRKLCLVAENQWVLCHWLPSPSEAEWRKLFGYNLEWPRTGQYYPTNVTLDRGEEPNEPVTWEVIYAIRGNQRKAPGEEARELQEAEDHRDAKRKESLYDEILNECTTYDHVPGTRDQVSYPAPAVSGQ